MKQQTPLETNKHTNSTQLSHAQQEKIANLCNVYGLNEQQTRQLIQQLKIGGNISIQNQPQQGRRRQPSIVETKNEQLSFNDSQFKFEQEYSFKQMRSNNNREQNLNNNNGVCGQQSFEKILMNKLRFEQQYYERIREQNQILKAQKQQMADRITMLLKMKQQQTQIIIGLKNTIVSLTNILKDKQTAYNQLQDNYNKLTIQQSRLSQISVPPKIQKQISKLKLDKRDSRQNVLTQISIKQSNLQRRQSKQLSKTKSTTAINKPDQKIYQQQQSQIIQPQQSSNNMNNGANRGNENCYNQNMGRYNGPEKSDSNRYSQAFNKKQKIDISKYKVFIDELRNITINKNRN